MNHFYYDNSNKDYWKETPSGWLCLSKGDLTLHLKSQMFSPHKMDGKFISPLEKEIRRIQEEHRVDYCGPLAGWHKGLHSFYGNNVLVTSSPQLLTPTEGDWPFWRAFLETLFSPHPEQLDHFLSHMKVSLECFYNQIWRPRQGILLIGVKNCGKSFLQYRITDLIGQRAADPWLYIIGKTTFNRELFGAEHLCVEDPVLSSFHERMDFSNAIKRLMFSEVQTCHGKFRESIPLKPRYYLSISANSELHNMPLNNLDESMLDKVSIYKCREESMPPEGFKDVPYNEVVPLVRKELPHFAWFILNQYKIPDHIKCVRTGAKAFQHPELVQAINENLAEFRLLNVLEDHGFFKNGMWSGTVEDLVDQLGHIAVNASIRNLMGSTQRIAYLLSRLSQRMPHRVWQMPRTKFKRGQWVILSEATEEN